jgi:hypothetical protein
MKSIRKTTSEPRKVKLKPRRRTVVKGEPERIQAIANFAGLAPKRREAAALQWALGAVSDQFSYQAGALAAKAPKAPTAAWRQACVAMTLQDFDAARAAIENVRANKIFIHAAQVLDVMLLREQGDADGAIDAFRTHLAVALKRPRKMSWHVIAGLYHLVGLREPDVVARIVAAWGPKHAEVELFRQIAQAD